MSEIKIHIVASNNPEAKKAKSNLSKLYKNYPVSRANVIVALGGDALKVIFLFICLRLISLCEIECFI